MRISPLASMSFAAATTILALGGAGCGDWQSVVDDVLKHSGDHSAPAGYCDYGGKVYPVGVSFPGTDGCNTCQCDKDGVSCTLRACPGGGTGGNSGSSTCEKVPVTADSGECVPYATWKLSSTELCAARGETLNDIRFTDTCEDGQSTRQVILVCCQPQPPANDIQCKPTVDSSGRNCTVCVDAKGAVVKTDCREP